MRFIIDLCVLEMCVVDIKEVNNIQELIFMIMYTNDSSFVDLSEFVGLYRAGIMYLCSLEPN